MRGLGSAIHGFNQFRPAQGSGHLIFQSSDVGASFNLIGSFRLYKAEEAGGVDRGAGRGHAYRLFRAQETIEQIQSLVDLLLNFFSRSAHQGFLQSRREVFSGAGGGAGDLDWRLSPMETVLL